MQSTTLWCRHTLNEKKNSFGINLYNEENVIFFVLYLWVLMNKLGARKISQRVIKLKLACF